MLGYPAFFLDLLADKWSNNSAADGVLALYKNPSGLLT
jgi:hypothetical protein